MLHLSDVFQFIIHRLYNGSLAEKQPVWNAHQRSSHIAFQFGDELYAIHEQPLEEIPSDIAFVRDQFAIDEPDEFLVFQRFPVIHVTWEMFQAAVAWVMEQYHDELASALQRVESRW